MSESEEARWLCVVRWLALQGRHSHALTLAAYSGDWLGLGARRVGRRPGVLVLDSGREGRRAAQLRVCARGCPESLSNAVVARSTVVVDRSTPLVEGSTVVVEGSTRVVEGSTTLVKDSTIVVEGATAPVEPSFVVVEGSTSIVESLGGVVEGVALRRRGTEPSAGPAVRMSRAPSPASNSFRTSNRMAWALR